MEYYRPKIETMLVQYEGLGTSTSWIDNNTLYEIEQPKTHQLRHYGYNYVFFKEKDTNNFSMRLPKDVFDLVMERDND